MATRKVKRFNEGGEGFGEGFGGGETGGGANAPGTGGNIPGGGYDGGSDNSNLTSRRVVAGDTMSRFPGAPSNAPVGTYGRVTIAPEAEAAPAGRYGRTTIASDSSPEEAAAHMSSMQAIADDRSASAPPGRDNATTNVSEGMGFNSNDRAKGGMIKKYAKGGSVSSASSRGDGIAQRGKTKGRIC